MFESVVVTGSTVSRVNVVGSNVGVASMTVFSGATSLLTGNTLYVDAVNGHDTGPDAGVSGNAAKPFLTLAAAFAAALSGDYVAVGPGTYDIATIPDGVNVVLDAGATLVTNGVDKLFDDFAGARTATVSGFGNLQLGDVEIRVLQNASDISITCNNITISCGNFCFQQTDGKITLRANDIHAIGGGTFWWTNGEFNCHAVAITNEAGDYNMVHFDTDAVPVATGQFHLTANTLTTNNSGGGLFNGQVEADRRIWIRGNLIRSTVGEVCNVSNGHFYLEAEKTQGILAGGGPDYHFTIQKHDGPIQSEGFHDIGLIDDTDMLGAANIFTGTGTLAGAKFTGLAGTGGFAVSGGTLRLVNCVIDTSANSGTNPITKSGGTLIIDDCTLIANAARNAIEAGTAQNVAVGGTLTTNRPNHANVTLTGGMLVRSDTGAVTVNGSIAATNLNGFGMGGIGFETTATITNGTWSFYASAAGTFLNMRAATATGTCTANVKINGVNVTGWSAVSVTNSATNTAATAANAVAQGDLITITISSASGTGATIYLRGTRP